jgi:hypothetical protein
VRGDGGGGEGERGGGENNYIESYLLGGGTINGQGQVRAKEFTKQKTKQKKYKTNILRYGAGKFAENEKTRKASAFIFSGQD